MGKKINPQVRPQSRLRHRERGGGVCAELTVVPTQVDSLPSRPCPLFPGPSPRKRGRCLLGRDVSLPLLLCSSGVREELREAGSPTGPTQAPHGMWLLGSPTFTQPSDTLSPQPVLVSGHSVAPKPSAVGL